VNDVEVDRARVVDRLKVDDLPAGRVSRLLLELTHDGLGFPIRLPVMVARGERPGPVFGLTAAVHGNELNGIPVIHRLFERLDPRSLRGAVVAVVTVNVPGLVRMQRELDDGVDLNDIMPGKANGSPAEQYAARFVELVVQDLDYLVDLHTASFGRVNSLYVRADMTNATVAEMAYLQRPQIILHNPPSDGTLRGAADELGIPSITLEIGSPHVFQPSYIRTAISGLRAVLGEVGMLPRRTASGVSETPLFCRRSFWMHADRGGLLEVFPEVVQRVTEGEVIARLRDMFGDVLREYRAPGEAVIIGKSVNPVGPSGARIAHLGVVAELDDRPFASPASARASLRGSSSQGSWMP
jgi:predicted deacylase